MIVVPDASAILKWVLEKEEGEDVSKALELQDAFIAQDLDLQVPTLWRYEVGNVLGLKQPELAGKLMRALLEFELQEVPLTQDYCLAVLALMHEIKGVTFYDSCYHALALQTKGFYLTADREYIKKAGWKGHVHLLSEWQRPRR